MNEKVVKMNVEETYVDADSTNLPKVDTSMLFDFLKNERKFSYADFENEKENLAINKYGDDSIGFVCVLRNSAYCVVKASITIDRGISSFAVRALVCETNNCISKIECKKCLPIECIHGFALLMWLHRRSEESVEQTVNYNKKPSSVFNRRSIQDMNEDHVLTPKTSSSSSKTTNFIHNNNHSPDTKIFLHGSGVLTQTSTYSSQLSQTLFHTTQQTSHETSQKSNSGSEFSQLSNPEIASHENYEAKNSASTQSSSQKIPSYLSQLSQAMYCTSEDASQKSSSGSNYSQIRSSQIAIQAHENCEAKNSTSIQSSSQKTATNLTQLSQATFYNSGDTSQKSSFNSNYSQLMSSQIAIREYCESESSESTQLSQKLSPLSQIANTERAISPKENKTARKAPYTTANTVKSISPTFLKKQTLLSVKSISPTSLKKQTLLSKKVSLLVKQPKIDHFFIRPKVEVEDSKPQIKQLFMGELVKSFLKLNKGTVEDFMAFTGKQMTDFLCQEAEKLTRVQRTDLWMDLRFGRITASIIHEAACCRTYNGSLVNKILGKVGRYQSPAMKRGIDLEDKILQEVQMQENITTKSSGLFLIPWCSIIGASPDAIGSDFIVEIKAPSSDATFETFLPNGNISKKCKSQMFLQMYCTGMKRGIFCVADPNFEINKKVTTVWLDYDEKEFHETLEKAKMFWISAIFPKLVNL